MVFSDFCNNLFVRNFSFKGKTLTQNQSDLLARQSSESLSKILVGLLFIVMFQLGNYIHIPTLHNLVLLDALLCAQLISCYFVFLGNP